MEPESALGTSKRLVRLGRVGKIILEYLRRYERRVGFAPVSFVPRLGLRSPYLYRGYRTQILLALYVQQGGNASTHGCRNLRKKIPAQDYDTLQIQLTKCLKRLEKNGLLSRIPVDRKTVGKRLKKRRWAFRLTPVGLAKANTIAREE
jgi:DNA-binding HxlR family transcriptional regulator